MAGLTCQEPACNPHKRRPNILQIRTVFGVSLLTEGSKVCVRDGERFLRIPVSSLKPEQEVLFAKQGVADIKVEAVGSALAKSERYAATMPVLFRQIEGRERMTAFSYFLHEGMRGLPDQWPAQIARAPTCPSGLPVLDRARSMIAALHIREALSDAGIQISAEHIQCNWLGSYVIAPRSRGLVAAALGPLSGSISGLMSEEFNEAYWLYIRIRQSVMHALSKMLRGECKAEMQGASASSSQSATGGRGAHNDTGPAFSARPEIELAAEYFASNITMAYASARVFEIKRLEPKGGGRKRQRGVLFRGIVTKAVPESEGIIVEEAEETPAAYVLGRKLIEACKSGYLSLVSEYMRAGADKDFQDEEGKTPLMHAIEGKKSEAAGMLLMNSVSLDISDKAGDTALMLAVRHDVPGVAAELVRRGALASRRNASGISALDEALKAGNTRLAGLLQKQMEKEGPAAQPPAAAEATPPAPMPGAASAEPPQEAPAIAAEIPLKKRRQLLNKLVGAAGSRHSEKMKSLIERGADPNGATVKGSTPLHAAVAIGNMGNVRYLVEECRARIDVVDAKGRSPLSIALGKGYAPIAEYLRSRCPPESLERADSQVKDLKEGRKSAQQSKSLIQAISANDSAALLSAIEKGADVNARHKANRTPLMHCAMRKGSANLARILLDKGADPNLFDYDGNSAAHYAIKNGSTQILSMLLAAKADTTMENLAKRDVVAEALESGNPECIRILRMHGVRIPREALSAFLSKGEAEEITRRPLPNEREQDEKGALNGNLQSSIVKDLPLDEVERLLQAGADPNQRAKKSKKTALMLRIIKGQDAACVSLLLRYGADPNLTDRNGDTSLIIAAKMTHPKTMRVLLEAGADPDIANRKGETAMSVCRKKRFLECIRVLEEHESRRR